MGRKRIPHSRAILEALRAHGYDFRDRSQDVLRITTPDGDTFSIDLVNRLRILGEQRHVDAVMEILRAMKETAE